MEGKFPAAVFDSKAAIRWLRANAREYNINPVAIGAIGDSAGAHLAAYLGLTKGMAELEGNGGYAGFGSTVRAILGLTKPGLLVSVSGCPELNDEPDALKLFLSGECSENDGVWAFASPVTHAFWNFTNWLDDTMTRSADFFYRLLQ
jgi:hypothetical protein